MNTRPTIPKSFAVTRGDFRISTVSGDGATVYMHSEQIGWFRIAWFLSPDEAWRWLTRLAGAGWADFPDLLADFYADRERAIQAREEWYAERRARERAS